MPKLYEYLGLIIFSYSNEHEPTASAMARRAKPSLF